MLSAASCRSLRTCAKAARRISFRRHWLSVASLEPTNDSVCSSPAAGLAFVLVAAAWAAAATNQNEQTTKLDQAVVPEQVGISTSTNDVSSGEEDESTTLLNWSGTHAVNVDAANYFEPESIEQVEEIVKLRHKKGRAIRPLGSALSPNAIGFHPEGMINMANLDEIVSVDQENMTITVQAGARVSQVVDSLRPYGLTLPNLASIAEQQMGGLVQVGAHGTGMNIAPMDHFVTKLKMVTPGLGTIELTADDGELFQLAKVGLGCLGVVVEVTMQCIPAHNLVEHTFVLTRKEAKEQVDKLLREHKHMRYMWIPYEDVVVVVTNDPEEELPADVPREQSTMSTEERFKPLTDLLIELTKDAPEPFTKESVEGMGFGELRDCLLAIDPLDPKHIRRCNKAEAEFWRRSEGYQTKPSDQLLQFDCGGQQWVWEVCFPTGTREQNNGNDMELMERLLAQIEELGIPAPPPIEQRWSASSSSLMSPAHGPANGLFSWVGIINYLPSDDQTQRRAITEKFTGDYCEVLRSIGNDMQAVSHWAKLERPGSIWKLVDLRLFMRARFPLDAFNKARATLDPKNILASPLINLVVGNPKEKS